MKLELIAVKNGSYKLDGRFHLKSGKADGSYAAWKPSKYSPEVYMLPATEAQVEEFNRLYSGETYIDVKFYLMQCYNDGKFDLNVFKDAINSKMAYMQEYVERRDGYEKSIKEATPVEFKIIGEGVWMETIESAERSRDVFLSSLYKYYVLQLDCGKQCVIVGEKVNSGEYVAHLPFIRAYESLNNEWRMGTAEKFLILFNNKKYYINK